jgi:hypothetical protein
MFTHIMERKIPEDQGDSLWNQCREELLRINQPVSISVKEVDRLAILVSHHIRGDFQYVIQEITSDTVNGFMDDLPF